MALLIPQFESLQADQPIDAVLLREGLRKMTHAIDSLTKQANVDPAGTMQAPTPIDSLSVSAGAGIFDLAITDNSPSRKGLFYFAEYDTSPAFPAPVVVFMGSSRNLRVNLGALKLYWRAYSQYLGSDPSTAVACGGSNPTLVDGSNATAATQQASQGSGTSSGSGGTGGFGGSGTGGGRGINLE